VIYYDNNRELPIQDDDYKDERKEDMSWYNEKLNLDFKQELNVI
jgi:hypothetical protein